MIESRVGREIGIRVKACGTNDHVDLVNLAIVILDAVWKDLLDAAADEGHIILHQCLEITRAGSKAPAARRPGRCQVLIDLGLVGELCLHRSVRESPEFLLFLGPSESHKLSLVHTALDFVSVFTIEVWILAEGQKFVLRVVDLRIENQQVNTLGKLESPGSPLTVPRNTPSRSFGSSHPNW